MGVRGSRRSARTEVGALERASADAAERIAVTLRKLKLWCAVVGTRSAGGVNPTMGSMNYRDFVTLAEHEVQWQMQEPSMRDQQKPKPAHEGRVALRAPGRGWLQDR